MTKSTECQLMRMSRSKHISCRTVYCIGNFRLIMTIKVEHHSNNTTVTKFTRHLQTILVLDKCIGLIWISFNIGCSIVQSQGLNISVDDSILPNFKKTISELCTSLTPKNQRHPLVIDQLILRVVLEINHEYHLHALPKILGYIHRQHK